ncbi:MAG: hypothetical protein ACOY82_10555 [Pseudomonadota bacterium]
MQRSAPMRIKTMVAAAFVGMVAWWLVAATFDAPFLRARVERADAERHYRNIVRMMRTDNWSGLCALTSSGFKGYLRSPDPLAPRRSDFGRNAYCRGLASNNTLPAHPDALSLVSIRNGPGAGMMTVEYVARWEYEDAATEITYIDAIERNLFGDVRMRYRWIFEQSTRNPPSASP